MITLLKRLNNTLLDETKFETINFHTENITKICTFKDISPSHFCRVKMICKSCMCEN